MATDHAGHSDHVTNGINGVNGASDHSPKTNGSETGKDLPGAGSANESFGSLKDTEEKYNVDLGIIKQSPKAGP